MTDDRQAKIDAIKAKLIGKALDKVYGDTKREHDVNFKEVVGSLEDKDGKEVEVKITAVQYGKKDKKDE